MPVVCFRDPGNDAPDSYRYSSSPTQEHEWCSSASVTQEYNSCRRLPSPRVRPSFGHGGNLNRERDSIRENRGSSIKAAVFEHSHRKADMVRRMMTVRGAHEGLRLDGGGAASGGSGGKVRAMRSGWGERRLKSRRMEVGRGGGRHGGNARPRDGDPKSPNSPSPPPHDRGSLAT